jgi:O-antigen/teichoic acid export membrane protein
MVEDLKRRITVSFVSANISRLSIMVISFGSKLILARLIAPDSWGLFAEAYLIMIICRAFCNLGIRSHLVRAKGNYYGNMFIIDISLSIVSVILFQFFAPLFSFLNSDLPDVLRLFSLFVLLNALSVVPIVFAEKELLLRRIIGCEIINFTVTAVVSILLAYLKFGVWSLVIGLLAGQSVFAGLSWYVLKEEIQIKWEIKQTGYLLKNSLYLFLVATFADAWTYIDNGIIGATLSEHTVGLYFMAYFIAAEVPHKIIYPTIYRVTYPAMSKLKGHKEKLIKVHWYSTIAIMSVEVPIAAFLFFNGDMVVSILLGEKWMSIIPLISVLCLAPIIDPLSKMGIELLKVLHYDRIILLYSILRLLLLIIVGVLLTKHTGAIGMAWAKLLVFGNIPIIWKVVTFYKTETAALLRDLLILYFLAFVIFGSFHYLGNDEVIQRIGFSTLAFLLTGGLYYKLFGKVFIDFVKSAQPKTELVTQ